MKRLRPRTSILGGAVIGLVAGVAAFGVTSTTATTPVTKPASFTKLAPVSIPDPPPPAPPRKAPCAKNQELRDGVCIVHVERVVVHNQPAAPVQAIAQASSRSSPQSQFGGGSGNQAKASANAQRSAGPQVRSSSAAPRSHESEHGDRKDSSDSSEHSAQQGAEGDG